MATRARALRGQKAPAHQRANVALQNTSEWEQSKREVEALGLKPHADGPKNWDALIALDLILSTFPSRDAAILDAGAAEYSSNLPWLYWYGYRDLHGLNLVFERDFNFGPIQYQPGDITRSPYPDNRFDVITCMSVLEHGVDVPAFLRECQRTLRPGGLLVLSVDYHEQKTPTEGLVAYGGPVHVFTRPELEAMVAEARSLGFEPTSDVQLAVKERPVHWKRMNISFTFALLAFRKVRTA